MVIGDTSVSRNGPGGLAELADLESKDAKRRDDEAEQQRPDRADHVAQCEEGGGEEDLEEDRGHDHGRETRIHRRVPEDARRHEG